jgi:hypothetical protein
MRIVTFFKKENMTILTSQQWRIVTTRVENRGLGRTFRSNGGN